MLHDYSVIALLNLIVFVCTFAAYYWRKTGVTFKDFALQYGRDFMGGFVINLFHNWVVYPAAISTREWIVALTFITERQLDSVRESMIMLLLPIAAAFMSYELLVSPRRVLATLMGFMCGTVTKKSD